VSVPLSKVKWVAVAAAIAAAGVAIHEWDYRQTHPYAGGPAAVIAILGVAVAVAVAALGYLAWKVEDWTAETTEIELRLIHSLFQQVKSLEREVRSLRTALDATCPDARELLKDLDELDDEDS
jgi:hypothetical protein